MAPSRFIPNDMPLQSLKVTPAELLSTTLDQLIRDIPPPLRTQSIVHPSHRSGGLLTGYTGIAYLFLHVSARRPDLLVAGHQAIEWSKRYLGENDPRSKLEKGCCGIASERLSYDAVKACITKDPNDVALFLSQVDHVVQAGKTREDGQEADPFPSELINGRAGTLYLLRMIKYWVPASEAEIDKAMEAIAEDLLATNDDGEGNWQWHGKRYFGAAHGDIGIITQLVLSVLSLAPRLSEKLQELLDYQLEDGNFSSSSASLERGKADLVQWCHGATGFIYSLQAIRDYFPDVRERIDDAISKAQSLVWKKGLLLKQPSLCHGIFGNAMVLPAGEKRDHFLSLATPSSVHRLQEQDSNMFQPASYGKDTSILMNYLPSAAWTWLVCEDEEPKMIMYTDV